MLQKDSTLLGVMVGIFFFITFYFGLSYLNDTLTGEYVFGSKFYGVRQQFIGVLAVFSNILPFIAYNKAHKDYSMRGVGIITIILAFGVVIYFNILGN